MLALSACGADSPSTPPAASATSSVSASTTSATTTTSVAPTSSAEQSTDPVATTTPEPPPPPRPTYDLMNGGPISTDVVVAAKIDNTNFGGLQYGTADADIVYVEMVEGGLTRLLALFHSVMPHEAGPIRSLRSTDPEVLRAYGAPALVFSGGEGGIDDLNSSSIVKASPEQISGAFWRSDVASGTYNLHCNIEQVAHGLPGISQPNSPGFEFNDAYPALGGGRDVSALRVSMQSPLQFETNNSGGYSYIRQGAVSVDANGPTVNIQNLLVQRVHAEPDGIVDTAGSQSYKSFTVGTGTFTLYRDNKAVDGTWSRPDANGPTSYLGPDGQPVQFKPGHSWVLLAPENATISEN